MKRLQLLPPGVRLVVFVFLVVGAFLLLAGATLFLLTLTLNSTPRQVGRALEDGVTVAQFAALPDEDAYPSTVAVGADGSVYTASFISGAVWKISANGETVTEIPTTRDTFDSVSALAVRPDDTLLAVGFAGGDSGDWAVYSITQDGEVQQFATRDDAAGFASPLDMVLDSDGAVYVLDRGQADIWRWNADGSEGTLWRSLLDSPGRSSAEARPLPTGITFDAQTNAFYVTDSDANTIVRVPRSGGAPSLVFRSTDTRFLPAFDGIAIGGDGAIYVTALEQKGLVRIQNDELVYIAGNFRGPSDIAFTPDGRLIVANFDSLALAQANIRPQLPFGLDVVTFAQG